MKKIIALLIAVVMVFTLSVTAFAASSPSKDKVYKVTIVDGKSDVIASPSVEEGVAVELESNSKNGKFNNWTVYKADGKTLAVAGVDYTLAAGTLNDADAEIIPLADIIICGNYDNVKTDPSVALKGDGSDKAPQTGDVTAMVLVLVMAAAAGLGLVAKKQFAK